MIKHKNYFNFDSMQEDNLLSLASSLQREKAWENRYQFFSEAFSMYNAAFRAHIE